MKASAITAKINKVARKYGPFELRQVYLRTVSESGGDVLIDRGVTQNVVDTLFSPQPILKRVGNKADVLSGTILVLPDDFEFLFTSAQMTTAAVINKSNIIVLKGAGRTDEQLNLITYNTIVLSGSEIGTRAIYRSVSR